jgi:hypothetical protein
MTNDSLIPLFYLAVIDGKEGYYDSYIVNTTDKEYFLRTRYEEKILKPKSALFYGEVVKDRDHESISPWVCDDKVRHICSILAIFHIIAKRKLTMSI